MEGSRPLASPPGARHASASELGRLFGSPRLIRGPRISRAAARGRSRRVLSLRRTVQMVLRHLHDPAQGHQVSKPVSVSVTTVSPEPPDPRRTGGWVIPFL